MELDLIGQLERSVVEPVPSDSSAAVEESGVKVNLELSIGWRSDDVGSRKRVREGDEAAEGKKPKMEGVLPYGLQVMPVIFRGTNGYCYACMVPCCVPFSVHAAENTQNNVYEPRINRNLAVATDGVAAGDCQEIAGGSGGLSSSGSSNSGTSVFQSFSAKEECSSTNESRNN